MSTSESSVSNAASPTTSSVDASINSSVDASLASNLRSVTSVQHVGRVVQAFGTSLQVSGIPARIGQRCKITDKHSGNVLFADVVGLKDGIAILFPLGSLVGVAVDSLVTVDEEETTVRVGDNMLGCVLNGLGEPITTSFCPMISLVILWMPIRPAHLPDRQSANNFPRALNRSIVCCQ